ncbi:hypothetical protein Glove_166g97 [Diversispora epigaea]|uniref:Uncharacterized protein n=1 Tax=Diversispora epigaea TaxID=1348612 RepID=A0A397IZJ5_9GLOM|nr:hypothetical protein Glove_166g97 [Diversispora epigaea]
MKMVNEEPSIKVTYNTNMKSQPMPNFYFSFDKNFTIYCEYYGSEICSDYFETESSGLDYNGDAYYIAYLPKGQILLNSDNYLSFHIYIVDETYDRLNQSNPMTMHAFDSEYPYQNKNPPKLINSIEVGNSYALTESNGTNVFYFEFYRINRQELDRSFLTLLGFNPKYETYNYIGSDIEIIEYLFSNGDGYYAKATIGLKTPVLEIEKEQRARTITEVLASVSALYGLMFSIYVFLFGETISKPLLEKYMTTANPSSDLKV